MVFSYFEVKERFRLRVVCKSWSELLLHPVILRHLNLRGLGNYAVYVCFHRATRIVSLDMFECFFQNCLPGCPRDAEDESKLMFLKRLCVARTFFSAEALRKLLEQTKALEELDISDTMIEGDISEDICNYASHSLRSLKLPCIHWAEQRVASIIDTCTKLVYLEGNEDMFTFQQIRDILFGRKLKKLRKLVCVNFSDAFFVDVLKNLQANSGKIELCLCESPDVTQSTKINLRNMNILICK